MQNNYIPSSASEAVNHLKRAYRDTLKSTGYSQLSINTFMKNDEVIILKSMVMDTNPRELDFLSTTDSIICAIENKRINIQAFVRQSFNDMDIDVFKIAVEIVEDAEDEYPFGSAIRTSTNCSCRYPVSRILTACNNVMPATHSEAA